MKDAENRKTILAGMLVSGAGTGIFSNCFGVYLTEVCAQLNFSRGEFSLVPTISLIISMSVVVWFGTILQRVSIKRVVIISACACSGVLIGFSFCSRLWQFYLLSAINGVAANGITMLTVGIMLNQIPIQSRGTAVGAAFAGTGIFSAFMTPFLSHIIFEYGWRTAYRIQAGIGAAVLIATALLLIEDKSAQAQESCAKSTLLSEPAIKDKRFWLLFAGVFCANLANLAMFNHSVAFLTGIGFGKRAAFVSAGATFLSIATKPLYGRLIDRRGLKAGAAALGAVLSLCAVSALLLPYNMVLVLPYTVLLSGCLCANSIPANAFAVRLFGKNAFVKLTAVLTAASTAGAAIGPAAAGFVFDSFGGYNVMWWICAMCGAAAALLLLAAARNSKKI